MIPVRCRGCMYRDRLVRQEDGGYWCPVREARASLPDCPDHEPDEDDLGPILHNEER